MNQMLLRQADQLYRTGRLADAERLYKDVLTADPANPGASRMLGYLRFQKGDVDQALNLLQVALAQDETAEALVNYGVVQEAAGRQQDALASFDRALMLNPALAPAHNNRGNLLLETGRLAEALASFDTTIALQPTNAGAHNNRGNTLRELGRPDEALASLDRALELEPRFSTAWNNRGNVLKTLERLDEALRDYAKAIALKPDYADAYYNRGVAFSVLKRHDDALRDYDKALSLRPGYRDAMHNRANTLRELKRHDEALLGFEELLTHYPDHADGWHGHGVTLKESGRIEDALASLDRAVALAPAHADAHTNRGDALLELGRTQEALDSFKAALAIAPDHTHAFGGVAMAALHVCDWDSVASSAALIAGKVREGRHNIPALTLMAYSQDAELLQRCAGNYIRSRIPVTPPPLWDGAPYRHGRIRLAYISSDFREHATSVLLAELIARHDRDRFDVIGISLAPDDASPLRARIAGAFDAFYDVHGKSFREVAQLLNDLQIDIAIDLNGHTHHSYPEILSWRAAPVQVNYLGFPGTLAMDAMDYIIADPTVLPMAQQPFFAEQIVHLPDCYQPNDRQRAIAAQTPSRAQAALPPTGIVFASFSGSWKLTAPVFDVWMRLLTAMPGSVLWLFDNGDSASTRLRAEAARRGVDPARLVFAPRLPLDQHLARHRLADLFLDTLPYNAHTTGSDALWAGLPVITCIGDSFPSRVGASLLKAVGLPELVTHSLEDYETLALALAREPQRLGDLRRRLVDNRDACALFDTDRYCRNLEAAYTRMWERAERGEKPEGFAVGVTSL